MSTAKTTYTASVDGVIVARTTTVRTYTHALLVESTDATVAARVAETRSLIEAIAGDVERIAYLEGRIAEDLASVGHRGLWAWTGKGAMSLQGQRDKCLAMGYRTFIVPAEEV